MKSLLLPALAALEANQSIVLATILERSGSAPSGVGASMLVFADGKTLGTVGGGAIEHRICQCASSCFSTQCSTLRHYRLAPNEVEDLGMVCGGDVTVLCQYLSSTSADVLAIFKELVRLIATHMNVWLLRLIAQSGKVQAMRVLTDRDEGASAADIAPFLKRSPFLRAGDPSLFFQPILNASQAYIFGGGHIAQELVPLLSHLDFAPVVFDDREAFANHALFPTADRVVLGDFSDIAKQVTIEPADYAIIMTRGHRYDHDLLVQVLHTQACYIGLIGSRSKIAHTKELLFTQSFTEQDFARVHTPIGLAIKAETPAEIAVSIAAEMILCRNERTNGN